MKSKKRVFLSYSYNDLEMAQRISHELKENNIDVISDYNNLSSGKIIIDELRYLIESSEIVLLIISKNFFKSNFSNYELSQFLLETQKRKVTIIPILIEKCEIPSYLMDFETINLVHNFNNGLKKIIERLKVIPEISFDNFSPMEFEKFIYDLLKEYGFKNVVSQSHNKDYGFDFKGEYLYKNPFGEPKQETWIIEVKFYKHERFSINAIKQLFDYKRQLLPADIKMLLVTNSILTSVAEEYLKDIQKIENTQIEVIDGLKLKTLIAKRKRLLNKYFLI